MAGKTVEGEHDFTLVLTGVTELTAEMEDALFEAGCDDATISVRSGRVFLAFTRTAPSFDEAVQSAVSDVKKTNFEAELETVADKIEPHRLPKLVLRAYRKLGIKTDTLFDPPAQTSAFDRLKFEVDYIKYLSTLCIAAVAFIATYTKNDAGPPSRMTGIALACFIVAACFCSFGYALKNGWVVTQHKPEWQVHLDLFFGVATLLVFMLGIVLLLAICLNPLWV